MNIKENETPGLIGLYRALRYAEGARLKVLASSALLIASQLVKLAIPWLTAQAINMCRLRARAAPRRR